MSKTQEAALPKKIDLGSEFYDIKEVEKLFDPSQSTKLGGRMIFNKSVLEVEKGISTQRKAHTVVHELVHFFIEFYGCKENIREDQLEGTIDVFSNAFMILIRRNPDLVKYIQELPE